jgi:hypothetical protein
MPFKDEIFDVVITREEIEYIENETERNVQLESKDDNFWHKVIVIGSQPLFHL